MSLEQLQRTVNNLDKEIANLEKKKAAEDKKVIDNQKRAMRVTISKNASVATVNSKRRQIERYKSNAFKAEQLSATYSKKIADKRAKRNEAYLKLQKEENREKKNQEKQIDNIRKTYENRIAELESDRVEMIEDNLKDSISDNELEYDVFISHATEDKKEFVDEFAKALEDRNIKIWYDKNEIKWGNSLRKTIDAGLKKSKFGVIVLSKNYIAEEKYWTKEELEGIFQLESANEQRLLPIWHNLTKKEVRDFSPILAGRIALTTATMTADEMADELSNMFSSEEKE